MYRNDKILALASSNKQMGMPLLPKPKPTKSTTPVAHDIVVSTKPVVTDINKIWSRPLDYNDFKDVFDFNNEYKNSSDIVKNLNLSPFATIACEKTPSSTRGALKCYETMQASEDEESFVEDSDDSVIDKDYIPQNDRDSDSSDANETSIRRIISADIHEPSEKSSYRPMILNSTQAAPSDDDNTTIVTIEINIAPETPPPQVYHENKDDGESSASCQEKGFTKTGLPRKRRKYNESLVERELIKKDKESEKLALKPPCVAAKCRKKCTTKISEEVRKNIHDRYLNLNWEGRGLFIKGMIERCSIKNRTTNDEESRRNASYKYYFNVDDKIEVCKTFFLTTLGYNSQNNKHVYMVLQKEIDEQKDKRGSYERKNVIDKNLIKGHIQKYNPIISHYRREHAPNKLYLPSDLSITLMHKNFTETYPCMKVSFESYRMVVKEMNISFAHLGNEECEQCELFKLHQNNNPDGCDQECAVCIKNQSHTQIYRQTREEYKSDVEKAATDPNCIYVSVDLQKVIMLPRMDQFKTAIFCPRIIAFNESFVPLGKKCNNSPYAVLWNECDSGRSQADIISAFRSFLTHHRDAENIILWADNCAAQNKNWAFMCFLVDIVNSNLIAAKEITVKYFETGHSFMSADHFHHQVEQSLKRKNKIYDFNDFVAAVTSSNSKNNVVKVMSVSDFYNYTDMSSQHRLKKLEPRVYLKDIMAVQAIRGEITIKHKETHVSEWKILDFLQLKIKKTGFPVVQPKLEPRGITKERKNKIIADLVPLMPETRREFWINLPVSAQELDL